MPWFRVTLAAGERRRTECIEARNASDAREAYSHARLPGIHIIAVEPDPDSGDSSMAAAPLAPHPHLPAAKAEESAEDAKNPPKTPEQAGVEDTAPRTSLSHLRLKTMAVALSAILSLMTRGAYGDHLPPVTPVLPGQDHRHEDHSGADFSFRDLSDVNFSEGNFTLTLFEDARLDRVLFIGATLDRALLRTHFADGANFTGASLVDAELRGMGGTGVVFADADLSGVAMDDSFFHFSDFRNVNFAGADLGEFTAEDSDFRGADLSSAVNLDSLFSGSVYDSSTRFPPGYDPQGAGMVFVPEPAAVHLLLVGLILFGLTRRTCIRMHSA